MSRTRIATRTWGEDDEIGVEFRLLGERTGNVIEVRRSRNIFALTREQRQAGVPTPLKVELNWSAWGSQNLTTTKAFLDVMQAAVGLAQMLENGLNTDAVRAMYSDAELEL